MKSFFTPLCIIYSFVTSGQTNPQIMFATPDLIQGTGEIGTTIEISTDNDFSAEHQITVDEKGNFKATLFDLCDYVIPGIALTLAFVI